MHVQNFMVTGYKIQSKIPTNFNKFKFIKEIVYDIHHSTHLKFSHAIPIIQRERLNAVASMEGKRRLNGEGSL